jgi:hypothetical protein
VLFLVLDTATTLAYAAAGDWIWPVVLFILVLLGQCAVAAVVASDTALGGRGWFGVRCVAFFDHRPR